MMKCRRLFAALLAVMMVVSMLGVAAYAEENDNVYVLNYNGTYGGAKWQYFSPYWPAFTVDGKADYTQSISFTLYDINNEEFFPTYCTDLEVSLDNNSNFRRINLEDSTYAGAGAGKLRSIFLKGFPRTDVAALGKAAGVEGLTVGEAVAATQAAIWQTAHGDRVEFTDFVDTIDTEWSPSATYHYEECNKEIANGYAAEANEATIDAHIEKVFTYLTNLEPTAPTGEVVSYKSFKAWDSELVANENGTYNVVATATVDVTMNENDTLKLTAKVGEYTASVDLEDGEKEYTLTIENVPANVAQGAVTLAISGIQSLADVYLFDAYGERNESQSLIGYTDNALPVYAAVNANDRVLIVNKTDDGKGLQNITFDIYYVCSVEEYLNHDVTIGTGIVEIDGVQYFSSPTDEDVAKYVQGYPFVTITTDANGQASYNFGNENDGIYIVVERENAVTTGAINPFFVAIPGGSSAVDTDKYEILVQPKNDVIEEDIIIEKDVNEIGKDHDTHDVNETHTWIIQTSIPAGLATGLKYEITDTLNYQLTFKGNVIVTVSEKAAAAHQDLLVLDEGVDYILTVTPGVDDEGRDNTTFKVALTASGMEKVAAVKGEAPEVRVYFDAVIDEDAILGTEIPNQAHISYENNVGVDFESDSDKPEVHTGGLKLHKVDASNGKALAGATFTLNTQDENGNYTVIATATTDANGEILFSGIAYGTYYLIETEAPEGYNLLTEPVEVTISSNSHLDDDVATTDVIEGTSVTVKNSAEFRLPETGGIGTAIFTFGGSGLIGAAAMVLLGGKKKKD